MAAHSIFLDDVDITSYVTPAGYRVGYSFEDGGQGGLMLNGSERVDELAQWSVITLPCMPLTEGRLQTLLSMLISEPVHKLTYYDPSVGDRTIYARRSISNPKHRGLGADGNEYWTGIVLTFKEVQP